MKPFDPTRSYCRRDKRPSKIIYTTIDGWHVVITEDDANYEYTYEVNSMGRLIDVERGGDDPLDLVNIPKKIDRGHKCPDLTKLGEAYGKLNEIADNPNIVGLDRFSKINQQIAIVLRAVKELLEENKP